MTEDAIWHKGLVFELQTAVGRVQLAGPDLHGKSTHVCFVSRCKQVVGRYGGVGLPCLVQATALFKTLSKRQRVNQRLIECSNFNLQLSGTEYRAGEGAQQ